jgi:hypothetical protein
MGAALGNKSDRFLWERTTGFLLPLIAAYCWAVVTATHLAWSEYWGVASLFAWTALCIGGAFYTCFRGAACLLGKGPLLSFEHALWTLSGAVCMTLLLPGFGAFKQLLLAQRGFPLDPLLAAMGRTMFGGASPWDVTAKLFGGLWPTLILDRLYSFWSLVFMAFPLAAPFLARDLKQCAHMQIAWVLAWILIGTVAAWCYASAGPCYYNDLVAPDSSYRAMTEHLRLLEREARQAGLILNNVEFQSLLLDAYHSGKYAPAGGISAMPSMHVSMATLLALAGRTVSRPLGHVLTGYGVLIWIASIYLGWHYAVDGPVAVVMMLGVWRLAGKIVDAASRAGPVAPKPSACAA